MTRWGSADRVPLCNNTTDNKVKDKDAKAHKGRRRVLIFLSMAVEPVGGYTMQCT